MALLECPECKNQVSDQAPACIHCGYPLRKPASEPEWETCQIQWANSVNLLGSPVGKDYFWAEVVSPEGTYCGGVSPKFKMSFGHAFGLWAARINDPWPRGNDSNATRPFHTKLCASCGEVVDNGVIQCPKCGSGIFATEKTH